MAHIYMHFDFGADESKAQEARHKLDTWRQAFRLDKKLQYKLDRPEDGEEGADETDDAGGAAKSKSKAKANDGSVSLLVRLYFSAHEKLSQQQWLDRIPVEEPFKSASPKVIHKGEPGFDEAVKQFADLD